MCQRQQTLLFTIRRFTAVWMDVKWLQICYRANKSNFDLMSPILTVTVASGFTSLITAKHVTDCLAEKRERVYSNTLNHTIFFLLFCFQITSSPVLKQWSTSLIPAHGVYELFSIHVHLSHCHTCYPAVLFTDWQPPLQPYSGLRPWAHSIDYSNKETTSVLLKLSNFAIKCLPGYLIAEHQILLLSESQKPITLTTRWHLIMGVCYCVKHLLWKASKWVVQV